MDVLTFSDTRARLKDVMDQVVDDHAPVIVTRRGGRHVVLVSLEDWRSMEATVHLMRSPANARRLRDSIAQLDAGQGVERELIDA